jgi:hypothetical protein
MRKTTTAALQRKYLQSVLTFRIPLALQKCQKTRVYHYDWAQSPLQEPNFALFSLSDVIASASAFSRWHVWIGTSERVTYSGHKITASLENVTVRREKDGKGKEEARWWRVCLSMYSITENIYYSQLSSIAILLQPEPVSRRVIQGKDWVLSPDVLSSCGLPLLPTCLLVTVNEARSYFASTIPGVCRTGWKGWEGRWGRGQT